MRALVVNGEWSPKESYQLTPEEARGHWARDARQVWRHPRWSLSEVPDPVLRSDEDVIIRVRAAGIAVSTLRMAMTDELGYVVLPYRMGMPLVPGHEFAGEVVAVGGSVRSVRVGDAVAAETLRACRQCSACRRGRPNACLDGEFVGFNSDGGLADFAVVPETHARSLEPLRGRLDEQSMYEMGALCEPAAVAYFALFKADRHLAPGANVAIFGCGPLGLAAVALAHGAGANLVVATEPAADRAAIASKVGADRVLAGEFGCELADELCNATGGRGFDLVVDASGAAAKVLPEVERIVAVGGHVVHLGVGGPAAPIHPIVTMMNGATHSFSMGHLGGFDPVIALQAAGRIDLTPIVTARYPITSGLEALAHAATRRSAKTLVTAGAA
ncbi:scyllo-inosose 3-dehydrogenase [Streptomyces sp. NPDC091219]|uniref:scyllo-inosose 3-dehydrogenase n=1 Tax=Streptomyces sp. NPDC091219 TaxID=3155193 RepID=UPI00344D29A2